MTTTRLFAAVSLAFTLVLTACGQTDGPRDDAPPPGPGETAPKDDFTAFEKSPPQAVPALRSAFYLQSGNDGALVAFYDGDRYFSGIVKTITPQHYQIQAVVGYYSETSGAIVPSRRRTTCRAWTQQGGEPTRIVGSTVGTQLVLTRGSTSAVLQRIQPPANPPANGYVVEWGCFAPGTGAFTAEAWSDVR